MLVLFLAVVKLSSGVSFPQQELLNTSTELAPVSPDGHNVTWLLPRCPLWRIYNSSTNTCECKDKANPNIIYFDDCQLFIKTCYCMTYSEELDEVFVSYCLYTCTLNIHKEFRKIKTTNISQLNDEICSLYKRTGLMCGQCLDDHAPAAYSYNLACVKCCDDYKYNWVRYIAVAYVPLTVFYVIVIVFRVPITTGPMIAFVTLSQLCLSPGLITFYSARFERNSIKFVNIFLALVTIWNLDFFRSVHEPFCLHPKMRTVDILSLEYLVGIYPLVLTVITYCLVQLHDHSRVMSRICMPVYACMYRFRKEWNIKESLIKAFATFLILSYVKVMNISAELLTPAHGYDYMDGSYLNKTFLYCNGSMEYFGEDHLPYAVLAIVMFVVFNLLPLILVFAYPCLCFQKFLNLLPCRQYALHIFMDTLQGSFREQPHDYRYFAGLFILLRMINLLLYGFLKNPVYYLCASCVMVFFAVFVAVKRPYKYSLYNLLDPWLFAVVIMLYIGLCIRFLGVYMVPKEAPHFNTAINVVCGIAVLCFILYGYVFLAYQIFPTSKIRKLFAKLCMNLLQHKELQEFDHRREDYTPLT